MYASLQAGLAFSNAILGAVHAMAHSLGGLLDLPHGECNALLLNSVVDFNYPARCDKYDNILQEIGIKISGMGLPARKKVLLDSIEELKQSVGINKTLSKVGVTKENIPLLAEKAVKDPCILTNPKEVKLKEAEELYERAL